MYYKIAHTARTSPYLETATPNVRKTKINPKKRVTTYKRRLSQEKDILKKNFERNTSLTHFLFHFIIYVGDL